MGKEPLNKLLNQYCDCKSVSVCMATYNGEKYVAGQVMSILQQLKSNDEVIVVDDCSRDDTVKILQGLDDNRIKIYFNDRNKGVNISFERAISLANNDIVFLSDQDDIWMEGRVSLMLAKLIDKGCLVVSSNSKFMDKEGREIITQNLTLKASDSSKNLKNILKIFLGRAPYYGCAMAFRKEIINLILPIPRFVQSHDLWIALASNLTGTNTHLDEETLFRRVHGNNVSIIKRRIFPKIWSRLVFGISIVVLLIRSCNSKKNKLHRIN